MEDSSSEDDEFDEFEKRPPVPIGRIKLVLPVMKRRRVDPQASIHPFLGKKELSPALRNRFTEVWVEQLYSPQNGANDIDGSGTAAAEEEEEEEKESDIYRIIRGSFARCPCLCRCAL